MKMPVFLCRLAVKIMDIQQIYQIFKKHPVITTDSRDCPEHAIFFALKGDKFNGNAYAKGALEKGCDYAVIDEQQYAEEGDERYILVDNVLITLQQLANCHRKALGTTIVGVTGTNGKTTTKGLIAAVLSTKYNVLYTKGNLNNQIGVPKTLLQLTPQHELAVVEMGASHPGDIKELVDIVEPDFGIITNVGKAHLLGFGSFEGVIHTKGELYDFIREHGGKVFINDDNPYLNGIVGGIEAVRYGQNADHELAVKGKLIDCSPFLHFEWNGHEVQTSLIGAYNIDNALAAATIGKFFNVPDDDISSAIAGYVPSNNRSQLMKTASNTLIIDAYNANPTSMEAALNNFSLIKAQKKMVMLGQMGELGEVSHEEHQKIADKLATMKLDGICLVGEEFQKVNCPEGARCFANVDELKQMIGSEKPEGTTILIKGSNSTHMFELPECL